jgi:glycosyltransferase involved in cell wall biosynthesis
MPKISIIVPVYNAAAFLPKCINSLIHQTEPDIEIILVNDGSTDNSLSICQEFSERDSRIRLINKANGGQSSARNAGLEIAAGIWIAFVDSDDYVEECMYEKLLAIAGDDTDMVISGYITEYNNLSQLNPVPDFIKDNYANESINQELAPFFIYYGKGICKRPLMGSVWRTLLRNSLLQKYQIHFQNLDLYEDLFFFLDILNVTKQIRIDRGCYYHYIQHINSSLQKYKINLTHTILRVLEKTSTVRLLSADKFKGYPDNRYKFLIILIRNLSKKPISIFAMRNELIQILKMDVFCSICNGIDFNNLPKTEKILFYPVKFKLAIVLLLLFKIRKFISRPFDP